MKPIKLIHFADGHYSRENQEPFFKSADFFLRSCKEEEPCLITIAGDLFDRAVNDTTGSGFPRLVQWMRDLMNIAPVVAVRGTPTHDLPGCYEVFKTIEARHNFTLLDPGEPYFLDNFNVQSKPNGHEKLLIFGLGEPSKEWFLKDKQLGKAEGDEAIKQGIREMLLGMGARRKQYPEIPCVLVSHITIAGASISETQSLPSGGIQIGKDDLALIGADYYALGHIHLAQQIGDLPAFYCGSMFPVNWGERDQKGFNVADLICGSPPVKRVPFPHLPRKKIVLEIPWNVPASEVEGFDVWIQLRATKEERHAVNVEALRTDLMNFGAGPGSKVEIVTIPTETVRSERISEAVSLVDKLKVYAELSGETLTDSTIEKAADLEKTVQESGEAEPHKMRATRLRMRGFIAIKKGIGKDETEVDLTRFDPGVVLICGKMGEGKTGLMENLHPFPTMVTHEKKLQDQCYLRDSYRDYYSIDELTGIEYRAYITIDGANQSGSCEYFLYKRTPGEEWETENDEINGRQKPYIEAVNRIWGSYTAFLRTAFSRQMHKSLDNNPSLSSAKPGEKKTLFREFGGFDRLQLCSDYSKENAKSVETKLTGMRAKLERVDETKDAIGKAKGDLNAKTSYQEEVEGNLALIKKKGEGLKAEHDRLKVIVDKNEKLRMECNNVLLQQRDNLNKRTELKHQVNEYRSALEGKEATEKLIKEYESLKTEEARLNEEKSKHEGARARGLADYNKAREAVEERERDLSNKKSEAEKAAQAVELERRDVLAGANQLEKELESLKGAQCPILSMECPAKDHESFQAVMSMREAQLKAEQETVFELDKNLTEQNKGVKAIQKEIDALDWPEKPKDEEYDLSELSLIRDQLYELSDIDKHRETLSRAQEAAVRIQEGEKQLTALEATFNTLNERVADLQHQIDEESETEYRDVAKRLEECRQQYVETDKELTRLNTEIDSLKKQIADKEAELEGLKALGEERKVKETDLTEWLYLQRAFGPNGIQPLELSAMAPDITSYANEFLEISREYPDSHYDQIKIDTQRVGGQGSNKHMIEDFIIFCHDMRDDSWSDYAEVSGGETAWLTRALYDAFGLVRLRKANCNHLTYLQDESDSAMDAEARGYWLHMIQRAHSITGRYHTIITSHSPELQEMIGQRIEMSELKEAAREPVTA